MIRLMAFSACLAVLVLAPSGAFARSYYGALVFSQDTRTEAYSYNKPSRAAAENAALQKCRAQGGGCVVVTWFRNACAALATTPEGAYGAGWSTSRSGAEKKALAICGQHGGGHCRSFGVYVAVTKRWPRSRSV